MPGLLGYLPLALLCTVPRLSGLWRRGADREWARAGAMLIVLGAASILSIWYYPDYIHIGFIAALFFVAIADAVERALRQAPFRLQAAVGWLLTLAILATLGMRVVRQVTTARTLEMITYQSAFGDVEVDPSWKSRYDKLADLLNASPSRSLYCHPISSYTYLLFDARNPTRFEFMQPWLGNTPAQADEVVRVLRSGEVPYVMMNPGFAHRKDPISAFVRERYELVADEELRSWGVWQLRRTDAASAIISAQ